RTCAEVNPPPTASPRPVTQPGEQNWPGFLQEGEEYAIQRKRILGHKALEDLGGVVDVDQGNRPQKDPEAPYAVCARQGLSRSDPHSQGEYVPGWPDQWARSSGRTIGSRMYISSSGESAWRMNGSRSGSIFLTTPTSTYCRTYCLLNVRQLSDTW